MPYSKDELEAMKKAELIDLIAELEPKADALEDFKAKYIAAKSELNKLQVRLKKEANYAAYGREGLTKEEYEALLRDKSM